MQLHYADKTISIAVVIALAEVGTPYELVRVDFSQAEQTKAPYLALNPKGRVPTLVTEGQTLTETGAILAYVAPQLIPTQPLAAARMREVMFFLASTMHVNHAHKMRGARWADRPESHADMAARVAENMAQNAAYLESTLAFAPFAVGAEMTLADPYLYVVLTWLQGDAVDPADYPRIAAYMDMMAQRPSVAAARAKGMLS